MKINKILLLLLSSLIILVSFLHAVDDEKILQIKLRQGFQYEQQGQFSDAEGIYKQSLEEFPHNSQVISRLINLYLRFNESDKLREFLETERKYLPKYTYELTHIELFVKENKLSQADKMTEQLLATASNNLSVYRRVAAIYQKYYDYDKAVEIYLSARNKSDNPTMYAQELAYIYQLQQKFEDAINEYLKILNPNTYKYIRYRLERLDLPYNEIIALLEQHQSQDTTAVLTEMIGELAVLAKDYEKALSVYSELGNDALIRLSELCAKEGAYNISVQCLQKVMETVKEDDLQTTCYLEQRIGALYYQSHEYDQAYDHFLRVVQLYAEKNIHLPRDQIKTAYQSLAYIELYQRKNPDKAREYIERLQEISSRNEEDPAISIMLAESYLREKDYVEVEKILDTILFDRLNDQQVRSLAEMKLLESKVLQGDFARADTLAKEFVALNYETPYLNDVAALYRIFNNELQLKSAQQSVQKAAENLISGFYFQDDGLVFTSFDSLKVALQDSSKIEFLLCQIADYAFEKREFERAAGLYEDMLSNYNKGTYVDYALFRTGAAYQEIDLIEQAKNYYEKYLLKYPQGTFAPEIRLSLKKFQK